MDVFFVLGMYVVGDGIMFVDCVLVFMFFYIDMFMLYVGYILFIGIFLCFGVYWGLI